MKKTAVFIYALLILATLIFRHHALAYPESLNNQQPANHLRSIDYPAKLQNSPFGSLTDNWGYPNRLCASYVAYKVWEYYGADISGWGDYDNWWNNSKSRGYSINHIPTKYSVIILSGGGAGIGHVMWVESVHKPDRQHSFNYVHISQYNQHGKGEYSEVDYPSEGFWFIHFS